MSQRKREARERDRSEDARVGMGRRVRSGEREEGGAKLGQRIKRHKLLCVMEGSYKRILHSTRDTANDLQ